MGTKNFDTTSFNGYWGDVVEYNGIIKDNEVFLLNMHISQYEQGNIFNHDETRTRKLLLHKKEIIKLSNQIAQKGITLVPVSLYFNQNKVKLELAIAKGKKLYDKRQDIAKKDAERRLLKHVDR